MKLQYEEPDIKIIECSREDIICSSDETPITPMSYDDTEL